MQLIRSLKGRVTTAVAIVLTLTFSLVLISVLSSFNDTVEQAAREQMASNANTMLAAAAKEENGALVITAVRLEIRKKLKEPVPAALR